MTDEFARFSGGPFNGRTFPLGAWPPPERLDENGRTAEAEAEEYYERIRMSAISDDDARKMTGIARGAEYEWKGRPAAATVGEHHDTHGALVTLSMVGCVDCGTEAGMGYACCGSMRCREHDEVHRAG